jgi:hypothetical protein
LRVCACHKVGHEKENHNQANRQQVLSLAATLQSDSQSSGAAIGAGHGKRSQARTFSPWSQVVSLLYAQVTFTFINHIHQTPMQSLRRSPAASPCLLLEKTHVIQ